jgi:hypothetical protein
MIEEATLEHPEVALSLPCASSVRGKPLAWYYQEPRAAERRAREDVALRDAIERIVSEFPGYG